MKSFLRSLFTQFHHLNKPARLFLLALFMDGFLFAGWSLFFNLYIIDAGYSREFLGLINAAPSLSALILGVPMGLLSDRIGVKRAMIFGFILSNSMVFGMLLFQAEAWKLAAALLYGIAGQLYFLSQAPFMMRTSDDRSRDILFSFSFGVVPLANSLGNIIAGYLPENFTHWLHLTSRVSAYQATILASVFSGFLVLVPIFFIRDPHRSQPAASKEAKEPKPSLWKSISRPLTLKLALPNLLIGFGAGTLVPYFNVFFVEHFRLSDSALGILFSLGSLATGIACVVGPRLIGNLGGKIRTITLGQGISLVFLLLVGFSPWPWLAMVGYVIRGALMNAVAPLFDAFALERSHESEHGLVNSIRNLAWSVGWTVGPYISGVVQQRWGFSPLFINTAVMYALGVALTWIMFGRRSPSVAPAPLALSEVESKPTLD